LIQVNAAPGRELSKKTQSSSADNRKKIGSVALSAATTGNVSCR
jgi:hypothetical protein